MFPSSRLLHRLRSTATSTATATTSRWQRQQHQLKQVQFFHSKVLIANRGEIACRILRTCHELDIETVALYSTADTSNSWHARLASEAYQIGTGPTPSESYLLQDEIIDLALTTKAEAIHPGYGFLSENYDFAKKCQQAGLSFVGPPAEAIFDMGSKQRAKSIMERAGVPCTPGYAGDDQTPEVLLEKAQEIGFPVLIKAWHGGGGKGMRLVFSESEFLSSLQSCQREALAAVGDSHVLLEKYLQNPRHVEVQVAADMHGNVVHLYERDCSLQRRHQKIIEEAPGASDLDPSLRLELGEMAKRAAQAVGYVNAGTVEFLLDSNNSNYYFCEMNTRLQVEHGITEAITGIDLVEWQLRIAAGEKLPLRQEDIVPRGHAFEARIYAEHPVAGGLFMPSTGTIWHHAACIPPGDKINAGMVYDKNDNNDNKSEEGIRVDSGIPPYGPTTVGVYYDPMISKLVVLGKTRRRALQKLILALKQYQIAGTVKTNIDFLIQCAQHPVFEIAGAINTGFLDENEIPIVETEVVSPLAQAVGAYATTLWLERRLLDLDNDNNNNNNKYSPSPWSSHSGSWRMGGLAGRARRKLVLENGISFECISNRDGSVEVVTTTSPTTTSTSTDSESDNSAASVDRATTTTTTPIHVAGTWKKSSGIMDLVIDKTKRLKVTCVLQEDREWIRLRLWPQYQNHHYHHNVEENEEHDEYVWELDIRHPLYPQPSDSSSSSSRAHGLVKSPMPGRISRVHFSVGDAVKQGDVVVVMEAMKMEHPIKAPCDGQILELTLKVGDVVNDGVILFLVDDADDDDDDKGANAKGE